MNKETKAAALRSIFSSGELWEKRSDEEKISFLKAALKVFANYMKYFSFTNKLAIYNTMPTSSVIKSKEEWARNSVTVDVDATKIPFRVYKNGAYETVNLYDVSQTSAKNEADRFTYSHPNFQIEHIAIALKVDKADIEKFGLTRCVMDALRKTANVEYNSHTGKIASLILKTRYMPDRINDKELIDILTDVNSISSEELKESAITTACDKCKASSIDEVLWTWATETPRVHKNADTVQVLSAQINYVESHIKQLEEAGAPVADGLVKLRDSYKAKMANLIEVVNTEIDSIDTTIESIHNFYQREGIEFNAEMITDITAIPLYAEKITESGHFVTIMTDLDKNRMYAVLDAAYELGEWKTPANRVEEFTFDDSISDYRDFLRQVKKEDLAAIIPSGLKEELMQLDEEYRATHTQVENEDKTEKKNGFMSRFYHRKEANEVSTSTPEAKSSER